MNPQRLDEQGFGLGVRTHRFVKLGQIVEAGGHIRVVRAEYFLLNRQSLFKQRLGFGVFASPLVENGQGVNAHRGACILIASRFSSKDNELLGQGNRLLIFSLIFQLVNPLRQLGWSSIICWSLRAECEAEGNGQHDDKGFDGFEKRH